MACLSLPVALLCYCAVLTLGPLLMMSSELTLSQALSLTHRLSISFHTDNIFSLLYTYMDCLCLTLPFPRFCLVPCFLDCHSYIYLMILTPVVNPVSFFVCSYWIATPMNLLVLAHSSIWLLTPSSLLCPTANWWGLQPGDQLSANSFAGVPGPSTPHFSQQQTYFSHKVALWR